MIDRRNERFFPQNNTFSTLLQDLPDQNQILPKPNSAEYPDENSLYISSSHDRFLEQRQFDCDLNQTCRPAAIVESLESTCTEYCYAGKEKNATNLTRSFKMNISRWIKLFCFSIFHNFCQKSTARWTLSFWRGATAQIKRKYRVGKKELKAFKKFIHCLQNNILIFEIGFRTKQYPHRRRAESGSYLEVFSFSNFKN